MKKLLNLPNKEILQKASDKLEEIADYFVRIRQQESIQTGLFTGSAGIALFLFYYARYKADSKLNEKAMKYLSHAVNNMDKYFIHSICSGVSGICWCINHLIENEFIDKENEETISLCDNYLLSNILKDSSIGYYDYLHGAIGTANYLLPSELKGKEIEDEPVNISTVARIFSFKPGSLYSWYRNHLIFASRSDNGTTYKTAKNRGLK